MHPLNWFPPRCSDSKLARLPNSGGISPLNWFQGRSVAQYAKQRRTVVRPCLIAGQSLECRSLSR